jgi:hypothetical protein
MKMIKNREEIELLPQEAYSTLLCDLLHECLSRILDAYQETGTAWDPDQLGYICLIEEGDDVRGLEETGISPARNGLVGAYKEFVLWHPDARLWEVGVLYCNDYGIIFFVPDAEWLDHDLRSILADEAEDDHIRSNASSGIEGNAEYR